MNKLAELILEEEKQICKKIDFTELSGKKILITGSSGLIGIHYLACLNHIYQSGIKDFHLYAVTQSPPMSFLRDILDFECATIIEGDLTQYSFLSSLPKADYIIHAAGYGQPGKFMQNQVKTIALNTNTTFGLIEKLLPGGKFLFISSSEIYNGLLNPPYSEEQIGISNTTHPRSCYIEGKRCGEAICNAYRNLGYKIKSARLALAYGPGTRKDDSRVLNSFIQKAFTTGSIKLIDEGNAKRTYCYVSDAIEIMWNILFKGNKPIYNVGGNSGTTIRELALLIGSYLNIPVIFPSSSVSLNGAPDDVCLDMKLVMDEFNKTQFIDLIEGLRRTIEWQRVLYAN